MWKGKNVSRVLKYEDCEIIHPVKNWIKDIEEKDENVNKMDGEIGKEKSNFG